MKKGLLKSMIALPIVGLSSLPIISLASCGNNSSNVTISDSDKTQTVDSDGSAIFTFTLASSSTADEFSTPTISDVSSSDVTLSASIYSVSGTTLKVKVTVESNDADSIDVSFSMKIAKKDNSWSQTITGLKLSGVTVDQFTVTANAGEHGYFDTEGITTKTLGKYSTISESEMPTPTSEDSTKYVFSGWYKTAECVDKFDFSQTLTADTTIYAGWQEIVIGDPVCKKVSGNITITNDETNKLVTVTVGTPEGEESNELYITGTWEGYSFKFVPAVDDVEVQIDLGYGSDSCMITSDSKRCPFIIAKANEDTENEMSFGDVDLSITKNTATYIYDGRTHGDSSVTDTLKGTINAKADLKLKSTGTLTVNDSSSYKGYSQGIHCSKDLTIQKCTLNVSGYETALKGNKSVSIKSGTVNVVSATGDGIKTEDTDVSSKGKRRGDINLGGATITINSTKDAIQAAHNCYIGTSDGEPTLTINTGSFNTKWSESVTTDSQDLYFRIKDASTFADLNTYYFKVGFSNSSSKPSSYDEESTATLKKIATENTQPQPGPKNDSSTYYYWNLNRPFGYQYAYIQLMSRADDSVLATSNAITISSPSATMSKDLITINSISTSSIGTTSWESKSYKETITGTSGTRAGKTDYSSKGIKAANITMIGGTINSSTCDDFIHAKYGQYFEANTATSTAAEIGLGNVTITGGTINVKDCPDDGIHGDGTVTIGTSGATTTDDLTINITPDHTYSESYCCYEGIEGSVLNFYSGSTYVNVKDDGINAAECGNTSTDDVTINVMGGYLDITTCGGDVDGIDSNNTYTQSGGTVIVRGTTTDGGSSGTTTAFDIGDGKTGSMSSGTFIACGKMENSMSSTAGYSKTGTKTLSAGNSFTVTCGSTPYTIKCKNKLNNCSISVYSSLGDITIG